MTGHQEQIASLLAKHMSGYECRTVRMLGQGWVNVAYEVNGELVVRFGKEADAAKRANVVRGEAELLRRVQVICPLPAPHVAFADPEAGCLAYWKVPGTPLRDLPRELMPEPIAAHLGELLAALHRVPPSSMANLVPADDQPPAGWLADAAQGYERVVAHVPNGCRSRIEAFLASRPPEPAGALVFSHNDLGIEHVLVDPGTWNITGIIDWGDAALCDPAYDFGLIHRDLGPGGAAAALVRYRGVLPADASLEARAAFYARCTVLEDLEYGIETGDRRYADQSLVALAWLFPG